MTTVAAELAFVGLAVRDLARAQTFYETLLGRPPDVLVHDQEVMWRVAETAWLFVRVEPERAGGGIVMLAVANLAAALDALEHRGLTPPVVETVAGNLKATLLDPDGNEVSFAQLGT